MAGASAERQENGVIEKIKSAVKANENNPVTLKAGKTLLEGVIDAEKFTGRQLGGSEPYTDVVIYVMRKGKKVGINCSLKGESAPSLAGGGLKGLELAVPGIARKFMNAAYKKLKDDKKLRMGDKVPDVFGKISGSDKLKIVIGNVQMGGPIDFMYIGPMNVTGTYDPKKNLLPLNGDLIDATEYAKTHDLYFRLRARREDQRFDPDAKDKQGTPKIYGVSPSKGDSAGRIVVTDKVPSTGVIVNL
ncbi:MAG: hypothetical protein EB127_12545 [Alphaproteobacteria bacterium]|nr:hypothetical protein [Alphaproteobacteria bacterium]